MVMTQQGKPNLGQTMMVMGAAMVLARASKLHAGYRVAQMFDHVWPSLPRGQFCLYTDKRDGRPVGFCNWALVSEKILGELYEEKRDIRPNDWDTGNIPFFPEMIAPHGHLRAIIADLRDNAMRGVPWAYSVRGVMADEDGTMPERRTFKWKGRTPGPKAPASTETEPYSPIRKI